MSGFSRNKVRGTEGPLTLNVCFSGAKVPLKPVQALQFQDTQDSLIEQLDFESLPVIEGGPAEFEIIPDGKKVVDGKKDRGSRGSRRRLLKAVAEQCRRASSGEGEDGGAAGPEACRAEVRTDVQEVANGKKRTKVPVVPATHLEKAALRAAELCLKANQIDAESPVALLDVTVLKQRAAKWKKHLPRVVPMYAVKCNSEPAILEALWELWQQWGYGGFDAASPAEMKLVLDLAGIQPNKDVLYANPCKHKKAIEYAKTVGVTKLIFDNKAELEKLAEIHPTAELVLRVQTDDTLAQCPLSNKFGATVAGCKDLLAHARSLGLKVVGVSFHVGSGCSKGGAFLSAMERAKEVWDEAVQQGFEMKLLDIGGGFPGWDETDQASFADHSADINNALEEHFASTEILVVAEPGRFFAAPAQAVLAEVTSVAHFADGNRYYLNDGLYGSFNCLLYDHAKVPKPTVLRDEKELHPEKAGPSMKCTVFGPTCDGLDMISDELLLPELEVGDHLLFPQMGAYTSSASTHFNGFCPAQPFVYESYLLDG
mmetsp:Transcript_43178/g.99534  ORF Transcript_43178/g.99534 Transcript_43178/m.99534 type:complete len:541 (+) Transcript_43178:130-1752(+)